MNTKQLLQSVSVQNQGSIAQADSMASSDLAAGLITQAEADLVSDFVNNESAAGPGSFALAQQNLAALISKITSE